ncbi:MAG: hypothetical protein ACJ708_08510, partial [Nitrososphaeraceae archaeon]
SVSLGLGHILIQYSYLFLPLFFENRLYFLFQDFIERYCLTPVISQIEDTMIIPANKTLRKIHDAQDLDMQNRDMTILYP